MREVPALARGLRILELLAAARTPLRISEIAARLELPRSATYELVNTLKAFRAVDQLADGGIVLGAKLFVLGSSFASGVDIGRLANDVANQLRDMSDETIQVAVLDERFVLYIAKADSSRQLRLVSNIGRRLPAHVTGLGKALLASLPDDEFEALMKGVQLETYTPTSIGSMEKLRQEIREIRARGYSYDDSESSPDVQCIAAPVRDRTGSVVAAISMSVPSSRMTDERRDEAIRDVEWAATELSSRLGYIDLAAHGAPVEQLA